jgi:hypothetical protein
MRRANKNRPASVHAVQCFCRNKDMTTTNIIIGVALAIFFGALIVAWFRNYRNFFAAALALGIAAAGVAVTAYRVQQYNEQKAVVHSERAAIQTSPVYGSSAPPIGQRPAIFPRQPVIMGGRAGAAAQTNPYLDAGN